MKKFASVFMALAYCYAVSFGMTPSFVDTAQENQEQECELISVSTGFLSQHTTQAEDILSSVNTTPISSEKLQLKQCRDECQCFQQKSETKFNQYYFYYSNFHTEHPATDLIYPFHNFLCFFRVPFHLMDFIPSEKKISLY